MPEQHSHSAAQTILITGASSDLGMALARRLLSNNQSATLIAHSMTGGARIQSLVEEFGDRIFPVTADCADTDSVARMADEIAAKFVTPTQIVHLPALRLKYERLSKFDLQHFHQDMAVQVDSAVLLLKKFAPKMSKLPSARMVFVLSSVTRAMPPKFLSMYTVTKYAQLGLMRAAAAEYAATNFTVNAVSPSMIETQFVQEIGDLAVRMSADANPKGRNAQTEDVIGAIEFLLSPGASYMTGIDIPITGGSYC